MKRMKMHVQSDVTFEQGCEAHLRDCLSEIDGV